MGWQREIAKYIERVGVGRASLEALCIGLGIYLSIAAIALRYGGVL